MARIVAGQPYASLRDLWERAAVSRPVAERLVLVGALDAVYEIGGEPPAAAAARRAKPASARSGDRGPGVPGVVPGEAERGVAPGPAL